MQQTDRNVKWFIIKRCKKIFPIDCDISCIHVKWIWIAGTKENMSIELCMHCRERRLSPLGLYPW